jgi:hypothetical protein
LSRRYPAESVTMGRKSVGRARGRTFLHFFANLHSLWILDIFFSIDAMDEMGIRAAAGIAWFLPESGCPRDPGVPHYVLDGGSGGGGGHFPASPKSKSRPDSASRRRRRRRHVSAKVVEDGVDVIDIEDEDHSFTSFFVGMGEQSTSAASSSTNSSEASEVKRPMVQPTFNGKQCPSYCRLSSSVYYPLFFSCVPGLKVLGGVESAKVLF